MLKKHINNSVNLIFIILLGICFSLREAQSQTCIPSDCVALGYNRIVSQCNGSDSVKCPFDTTKVFCKPYVSPPLGPMVGNFYFSDGSYGMDISSGTIIGMIADVDGNHGLVLALDGKSLMWGRHDVRKLYNYGLSAVGKDMLGKYNTFIINDQDSYGGNFPAANYCYRYNKPGKASGEWYLPSVGEWKKMMNDPNLNLMLKVFGFPEVKDTDYWSSNQVNDWYAYAINNNDILSLDKNFEVATRCIFAF